MSKIHRSNPNAPPDREFTPGALEFLVVGNCCRLLDRRRTPGRIEALLPDSGFFRWRILDFEDAGKFWDVPIEDVVRFQFELNSRTEAPSIVADLESRIDVCRRPLIVTAQASEREATRRLLDERAQEVGDWLRARFGERALGEIGGDLEAPHVSALCIAMQDYMGMQGLSELERLTTQTYVLNPFSGEWIKGMEIVLAEMGFKDFVGTVVRDKGLFEGLGDKRLRRQYLLSRLGFMRAMFDLIGRRELKLYRGMSAEGPWRSGRDRYFSSWALSREVAESFASFGEDARVAHSYLIMRTFPIHRLFMTVIETSAMRAQYREEEAVVMAAPEDRLLW